MVKELSRILEISGLAVEGLRKSHLHKELPL
jgi:hypothetical protein